jgi:hypothetical protein
VCGLRAQLLVSQILLGQKTSAGPHSRTLASREVRDGRGRCWRWGGWRCEWVQDVGGWLGVGAWPAQTGGCLADQVQQGAGAGARHAANLRAAHRCARLPSVLLQGHGRRCSTHPDPMHMQRRALATAGVQTFQVCWRGLRRPQVGDGRLPSAQQEHQKALQNGLTGAYPMPLGEARHVPCPRACVMNERGERCASNSGLPFCEW